MPYDYYKCSVRLRDLRQERRESHQTLAKCFGEDGISIKTLKDYETAARNGGYPTGAKSDKTKSISGMSVEKLAILADHFGVTTDYLLGISDLRSTDPSVQSAAKTTGLDENAIRNLALEALTGKKSPMLQAVDLLLTTRSGKQFLQDLYRYAIVEYDKFTCKQGKKEINLDSVYLNGEQLDIEKMGYSFMMQVQDDLFRLKDEYDDMKEAKRNG